MSVINVSPQKVLKFNTRPDTSLLKSRQSESDMQSCESNKFSCAQCGLSGLRVHFLGTSFTLNSAVQQMIDKCSPSLRHRHEPFLHLIG